MAKVLSTSPAMTITRPPARAALRPFVQLFWASDERAEPRRHPRREAILPTGTAHIAVRLSDEPLRFFADADDCVGFTLKGAIVGGVRTRPYVKELAVPAPTVGAQFWPGAASLLLATPAQHFAETHCALEDLWGASAAAEARERLAAARDLATRIDIFEDILAARLPRVRGLHPAIAATLPQLHAVRDVGRVVERSGVSHRHFDRLFTEAIGLNPKLYLRVARFARVLDRLQHEPDAAWADVAAGAGYADQPHFNREFRAFSSFSPSRYRALAAGSGRHVPL
jgi:AraC-like DNA-binding protein